MLQSTVVADEIIRTVLSVVKTGCEKRFPVLDAFPVAVYLTDTDGFITYFNPACVDFAGREPTVGRDRWCVTSRLYTDEGVYLPHEQCPMAIAIRTKRVVRGVTAVAERPDGTRVNFLPFPTPLIDENGELQGAVNVLIDIAVSDALYGDLQILKSIFVEHVLSELSIDDVRMLVDEMESELERPCSDRLN